MSRYILDACALLALLRDEPGGELLTADHDEFEPIEESEPIQFHWIR